MSDESKSTPNPRCKKPAEALRPQDFVPPGRTVGRDPFSAAYGVDRPWSFPAATEAEGGGS